MKLFIIGDRACGKSSLAQAAAKHLGWPYFDVDQGIKTKTGRSNAELWATIDIVEFRHIESEIMKEMCAHDPGVVAFSAGAPVQPQNFYLLENDPDAFVVYLHGTTELLWERLQADPKSNSQRPQQSAGGIQEVVELYNKRHPIYDGFADVNLDAALPPAELLDCLIKKLPESHRRRDR